MAVLNFPSNPNLNQVYQANESSWRWDGDRWKRLPDPGAVGAQGPAGIGGTWASSTVGIWTGRNVGIGSELPTAKLDVAGLTTTKELYVEDSLRADTIIVAGISTFSGNIDVQNLSTFTGGVDINADLDVDGHVNLDNVSISGVVTALTYHGDGSKLTGIAVTDYVHTNTLQVNGISTLTGSVELDSTVIDIHGNVGVARSVLTATGSGVSWSPSSAGVTISDTTPVGPYVGDLWWESDTGELGIYYDDGNSEQWVTVSQGPIGPQGVQGAQGAPGTVGAQGAQGAPGAPGAQGAQGAPGAPGAQGAPGVQGAQGAPGAPGAQGAQGAPGAPGAQGAQGAQGHQGNDGNFGGATFEYQFTDATVGNNTNITPGKLAFNNSNITSATQLFIDDLDGGDTNTDIQSFLTTIDDSTSTIKGHFRISNKLDADDFALFTISAASSVNTFWTVTCAHVSGSASSFSNNEDVIITFARTGDKGDGGSPGAQGAQGAPGAPGAQGAQGAPGAPGAQGAQGSPGSDGDDGAGGSPGSPGAQGAPGAGGSPGAQGAQGAPGGAGTPGAQGAPGAPGAQGAQGAPGSGGSPGAQGAPGAGGSPGAQGAPGSGGGTGPTGPPGAAGAQGAPGSSGGTGPTGPPGAQGAQGAPGGAGGTGPTGAPGSPGAQGAPGAAGAQGAQGAPAAGANGIVRQVVSAKGPSSQTSYNSGTWTTIVSQSITVSSSSNRVLVSVKAGFYGGDEGSAYNGGKLLRGSSNIWEVGSIWGRVNAGSGFKASIDGPTLIDNPGSGSHTYYWQTRQHNASGSNVVVQADGNSITLTEFTP